MLNSKKVQYGCDYSWNVITGCSRCEGECKHCYVIRNRRKYPRIEFHASNLNDPETRKTPQLINVVPLGDLFHENVTDEQIRSIWQVMTELAPQHQYIIQTRRLERVASLHFDWPLNIWLGTSIESPAQMLRFATLKEIPAKLKFVAFLPLTDEIRSPDLQGIDWVITGGEIANKRYAQYCNAEWFERLYSLCKSKHIPFYFVKHGSRCVGQSETVLPYDTAHAMPFRAEWVNYYRERDLKLSIREGREWSWRMPFPEELKKIRSTPQRRNRPPQPTAPTVPEPPPQPLTSRREFHRLEKIIQNAIIGHFAAGEALLRIRDEKLYKLDGFHSFGKYCENRFSMSRMHGYRLIAHYQINHVLKEQGMEELPERQIRLLHGIPFTEAAEIVRQAKAESELVPFLDGLARQAQTYRNAHKQTRTASEEQGIVYSAILRKKCSMADYGSWEQYVIQESHGDLKLAGALYQEFCHLESLGDLNKEEIARGVLELHNQAIQSFAQSLDIASIAPSYEIEELPF